MANPSLFNRLTTWAANASGTPVASIGSAALIAIWAACGPVFHYSETWQLVINTGTTIVTFLMVFLIQSSQNETHAPSNSNLMKSSVLSKMQKTN